MPRRLLLSVNNSWNVLNFRVALVRRLQAAGFEVGVMSPADAHAAQLARLGVTHLPIAIDSKGLSPAADIRLLWQYRQIMRKWRPAALLAWTIKPNIYGSIAAHSLGIPVINNVSGLGTAFIRRGLLNQIASALYRVAFSRSATVFFQNPEDRGLFIGKGLVATKQAALLPGSGIDTTRFVPITAASGPSPDRPFTFLLIARLLRDKGVFEYVEAARLTRVARPNVRFEILGSIDAVNRTAIAREQLFDWVDEGVIVHLGETDDVRPHIAAADCVVLPSYREGMPRALLEGAALAKPLIATRVPGCTEIARDNENALLCEVRDPVSLAQAMVQMIDLPVARRQAMGAAGRRIAVTEFDERIIGERYLAALATALKSGD